MDQHGTDAGRDEAARAQVADIEKAARQSLIDAWPGLAPEEAGAPAWALREAVTDVVRHGESATVCTVPTS
ncbi:hypothetical protein ABT093_12585 [Kitasatospora sp. NPDC002551]|uniref:hypothetical protein n=1 Tax=unclassified Kitasatospora TaxID=2633591 RepID=UPI003330E078